MEKTFFVPNWNSDNEEKLKECVEFRARQLETITRNQLILIKKGNSVGMTMTYSELGDMERPEFEKVSLIISERYEYENNPENRPQ